MSSHIPSARMKNLKVTETLYVGKCLCINVSSEMTRAELSSSHHPFLAKSKTTKGDTFFSMVMTDCQQPYKEKAAFLGVCINSVENFILCIWFY